MVRYGGAVRLAAVPLVILGGLAAEPHPAATQLPGAPRVDQLDAALLAHHADTYDRKLAEGRQVWFIVDADGEVLETGIGDEQGLEKTLQAEFPNIATDILFHFIHTTVEGRRAGRPPHSLPYGAPAGPAPPRFAPPGRSVGGLPTL